jgi:hypothetical protein
MNHVTTVRESHRERFYCRRRHAEAGIPVPCTELQTSGGGTIWGKQPNGPIPRTRVVHTTVLHATRTPTMTPTVYTHPT